MFWKLGAYLAGFLHFLGTSAWTDGGYRLTPGHSFCLRTISGVFRTHSTGSVAAADCLRRGKRKKSTTLPSNGSSLGYIPAPLPVCSLPVPPSVVESPSSREPVPAPAASSCQSLFWWQDPSLSHPDLPFQLVFLTSSSEALQGCPGICSRAPLRLQAQRSLCPGVFSCLLPRQSHTIPSQPHSGALFSKKYSWIPTTSDRMTASFSRILKSVLCPPLVFHGRLLTPMSCSALASLWISRISVFIIFSPSAPSGARRAGVGG